MPMTRPLFTCSTAGSLPKPDSLAETNKLSPRWQSEGAALAQRMGDATLLWIKEQEGAGLDVIGVGEQSRAHFVRGFLQNVVGIDFEIKVNMAMRNDRSDPVVHEVGVVMRL